MNKSLIKKSLLVAILLIAMCLTCLLNFNKLTYVEYEDFASTNAQPVCISESGTVVKQKFVSDFEILQSVAIQFGTYERSNNSEWTISVSEESSGEILYKEKINASYFQDCQYYKFDFDRNKSVIKGETYAITITADSVTENSAIAFFLGENQNAKNGDFTLNGEKQDGCISYKIYGGSRDSFWVGYSAFIWIFIALVLFRVMAVYEKAGKEAVLKDKWIIASVMAALIFVSVLPFSNDFIFLDENDNIRGGMLISNGGVLYRDYVVQHTPLAYYLCAVFAKLGAASVVQFRICYYILIAAVYGGMFLRYEGLIGRKKMFILPFLQLFVSYILNESYALKILSDNIQAICIMALVLEFIAYYKDRKLDWGRCVIISCYVWVSVMVAFISLFAIFWLVLVVLVLEIRFLWSQKANFTYMLNRYYRLLICAFVPLLVFIGYFYFTNSLNQAIDQIYLFNRLVYPHYSGYGSDIIHTFALGLQTYFGQVKMLIENMMLIFNGQITASLVISTVIFFGATLSLFHLFFQKKYAICFTLAALMAYSATRGYTGFHGAAAWYVAALIFVLYAETIVPKYMMGNKYVVICLSLILSLYVLYPYVNGYISNTQKDDIAQTDIDYAILEIVGEGESVIIDSVSYDTLYLNYKGINVINRVPYMLPWYMDWYEQWVIEDLNTYKPKLVVYNEAAEVWGHTYFANDFLAALKEDYCKLNNDPYSIYWIRKENVQNTNFA